MTRSTPIPDLVTRFRLHLRETRLFPEPGTVLVAVSGGSDSRALLELLVRVAREFGLELCVGHVDHGIAPTSDRWAEAVRALADAHGLPFELARAELGPAASETDARRGRYRALRAMQRRVGARYLVTGHHADDQVETVLFRFLRGSGPAGLAGIAPSGRRGLTRPLLPFRREALRAWLDTTVPDHGSVDDPANRDPRHERVWLRHDVLPMLRRRRPDVDARILAAAGHAAADRAAWGAVLTVLPELEFRRTAHGVEVARAPLEGYDKVLSEAILRALGREAGVVLSRRDVRRTAAFLRSTQSGRTLELSGGWTVETVFDRFRVHRPSARTVVPHEVVAWGAEPSGEATWGEWCITWRSEHAGPVGRRADTTWVTPGLGIVRAFHAGDRMRPLHGTGRRKVRRLLMEARVPRRERARYPVLERDGEILWIPGICRSAAALPRPGEPATRLDAHRHRDS